MNKYQEALNRFKDWLINTKEDVDITFDDIRDIQELIDNYLIMEEQVKICEHSADKKIEQLEKALDIAIDVIYSQDTIDFVSTKMCGKLIYPYTKENLKESILQESEKQ